MEMNNSFPSMVTKNVDAQNDTRVCHEHSMRIPSMRWVEGKGGLKPQSV